MLLPPLTARLDREAPGVSPIVRNASHGVGLPMLEDGSVELIADNFPEPPTHMREELLYEEDFICAARGDHSGLDGTIDLDRHFSLHHLRVSMKGNPRGPVDAVLAEKGRKREAGQRV